MSYTKLLIEVERAIADTMRDGARRLGLVLGRVTNTQGAPGAWLTVIDNPSLKALFLERDVSSVTFRLVLYSGCDGERRA